MVIGDGPALEKLRGQYPDVKFLGAMAGEELAAAYRAADCFVFPSKTDTFGLVIIEALASGLPVAGYPVPGPIDIVGRDGRGYDGSLPSSVGALDENLALAVDRALQVDRADAATFGSCYTWQAATDAFAAALSEAANPQALQSAALLEPT